jgi:hypothetical protein
MSESERSELPASEAASPAHERVLHTNIFSSKDAASSSLMPPKHIDQAYPRLVVMRTLAAALQSNWARLVAGSTSHFGLFRDALTVLEQDAPELDNALISDAISTLVNMADNLPLSGPSDWQAQHTASVLAELGKTLDRFPTADATTLQQLTEALAQLKAGDPNPPRFTFAPTLVASTAPAEPDIPAPMAAPPELPVLESIAIDDIPHLNTPVVEDALEDSEGQAAIEHAAFCAQSRGLFAAITRERLTHGVESAQRMAAASLLLAEAAVVAKQIAIAELAVTLADTLQRHEITGNLIELVADSVTVLSGMLEEVRQGLPATPAPDLIAALRGL